MPFKVNMMPAFSWTCGAVDVRLSGD